jgi:hypothetical protein
MEKAPQCPFNLNLKYELLDEIWRIKDNVKRLVNRVLWSWSLERPKSSNWIRCNINTSSYQHHVYSTPRCGKHIAVWGFLLLSERQHIGSGSGSVTPSLTTQRESRLSSPWDSRPWTSLDTMRDGRTLEAQCWTWWTPRTRALFHAAPQPRRTRTTAGGDGGSGCRL